MRLFKKDFRPKVKTNLKHRKFGEIQLKFF